MSFDVRAQMPDLEPTYSAREAAALLGRSYSWLDQRVRSGKLTSSDGTVLCPLRTPGGYRRFTPTMLQEMAFSGYRYGWFKMDKLKNILHELASVVYEDTGECIIPS